MGLISGVHTKKLAPTEINDGKKLWLAPNVPVHGRRMPLASCSLPASQLRLWKREQGLQAQHYHTWAMQRGVSRTSSLPHHHSWTNMKGALPSTMASCPPPCPHPRLPDSHEQRRGAVGNLSSLSYGPSLGCLLCSGTTRGLYSGQRAKAQLNTVCMLHCFHGWKGREQGEAKGKPMALASYSAERVYTGIQRSGQCSSPDSSIIPIDLNRSFACLRSWLRENLTFTRGRKARPNI